jgi:hypothetical protein
MYWHCMLDWNSCHETSMPRIIEGRTARPVARVAQEASTLGT